MDTVSRIPSTAPKIKTHLPHPPDLGRFSAQDAALFHPSAENTELGTRYDINCSYSSDKIKQIPSTNAGRNRPADTSPFCCRKGRPMLQLINIEKKYTTGDLTQAALNGVSLNLRDSEFVAILGPSGSGKTTLINILGALDRPTGGDVYFDGKKITGLSDKEMDKLRRNDMSFVFQSVALIPTMTAYENVEFAMRLVGMPYAERVKRAKECLVRVGLEKRMHHRPGELSGGEQQRVAIARAISHKPKLIFADEPTAALDMPTGLAVMNLFKELVHTDGLTIVMTTHDTAMMEQCDVVYTLDDGRITDVRKQVE